MKSCVCHQTSACVLWKISGIAWRRCRNACPCRPGIEKNWIADWLIAARRPVCPGTNFGLGCVAQRDEASAGVHAASQRRCRGRVPVVRNAAKRVGAGVRTGSWSDSSICCETCRSSERWSTGGCGEYCSLGFHMRSTTGSQTRSKSAAVYTSGGIRERGGAEHEARRGV